MARAKYVHAVMQRWHTAIIVREPTAPSVTASGSSVVGAYFPVCFAEQLVSTLGVSAT